MATPVVWLPLNGDLRNIGTYPSIATNHGATIDATGKIGSCYKNTASNYITIPVNIDITKDFSLSYWGRIDTWGAWRTLLTLNAATSGYYLGMCPNSTQGSIGTNWYEGDKRISDHYTGNVITVGTWFHITLVKKGTSIATYLNGVLSHTDSQVNAPSVNFTELTLFKRGTNATYGLNSLNDVRVYNEALSQKEVKELAQGLCLHYPLIAPLQANNLLYDTNKGTTGWAYNQAGGGAFSVANEPDGTVVLTCTTVATGWGAYISFNRVDRTLFATSQQYTLSFDVWSNKSYSLGIGYMQGNATNSCGGWGSCATKANEWVHFSNVTTFNTTNPNNGQIIYFSNVNHVNVTKIKNLTITYGNNLNQGYSVHSRDIVGYDGTQLKDTSGFDNDSTIVGTLTFQSDKDGRYNSSAIFGAVDTPRTYMNTPTKLLSALNHCTISWWQNNITTGNSLPFMGQDSYYYVGAGTTTTRIYDYNIGTAAYLYKDGIKETNKTIDSNNLCIRHNGVFYSQNSWHHYCLVDVDLTKWTQFQMNHYGGTWPIQARVADVRIYATVLSETDVKALYNIPFSIDNAAKMHGYEFVEQENLISVSKNGIIHTENISELNGLDYLKYDPNVYIEPDGSAWVHIAHHNNPAAVRFASNDSFSTSVYKDADRWFNGEVCKYLNKWEFIIRQKTTSSATEECYRISQTKSPFTAAWSDVQPAAATITRITSSGGKTYNTSSAYGGIYVLNSNTYFCCANSSNGNWFSICSCWALWNNGIPGYNGVAVTSGYQDLYVRIDNVDFTDIPVAKITKNGLYVAQQHIEI